MLFAHDTEASLLAAVALVNSAEEPDTLTTAGALDAFYRQHVYTGSRTHDRAELDEVRALRAPLRALLTSSRDDAVEIVNRMLADARAVPQLVRHDDEDWHLHATDRSAPFAQRMTLEVDLRALPGLATATHTAIADDDPDAVNTAQRPDRITPRDLDDPKPDGGRLQVVLPALSWNMIRLSY